MSLLTSSSPAPPLARWFRRLQWAVTALMLFVALAAAARLFWLGQQTRGFPLDWLAFWGGERVEGIARECPPLLAVGPNFHRNFQGPLPVDTNGAYRIFGPIDRGELGDWWPEGHSGLDWTISAWSQIHAAATNRPSQIFLVAGGVGYPHDWQLVRQPGKVGVLIGTTGPLPRDSLHSADRPVPQWEFWAPFEDEAGAWVHLAATYDGTRNEVVLFAAGEEVGRAITPYRDEAPHNCLMFGWDPWSFISPAILRWLDDLALFRRTLTPDEVARLAEVGRDGALSVFDLRGQLNETKLAVRNWSLPLSMGLLAVWGLPWTVSWWRRLLIPIAAVSRRALLPVGLVAGIGFIATLSATLLAHHWMVTMATRRFENVIKQHQEAVDAYFEKVMTLLYAIRAQLPPSGGVTPEAWQSALEGTNLRGDFPLTRPIGYAEYVRPGQRAEHITRVGRPWGDGYRIYSVSPLEQPVAEHETNAALPVTYSTRPGSRRTPAWNFYLGRDLLAPQLTNQPNRLLAQMALEGLSARRSAPPAEMLTSAIPGASQAGLMLFVPVPDRARTEEPRRGLIFAGTEIPHFLRSIYGPTGPDFGIRWFWETPGAERILAADSGGVWTKTREPGQPWLRQKATILLYNAKLQCDFWTTPEFDRNHHRDAPWLVALAGAAFTLLTAGLVVVQVRARLTETAVAENLRGLNAELAAANRERARLSRDLHDGTIQNLYALGLELGQARTLVRTDPPRAEAELGHTLTTLQAAITELRQFVLELEPEAWQGQSVRSALESLVARLRRTTALEFHLSVSPAADALPAKTAIQVLQLVREGLSNVLRHAEARQVWVELRLGGRREAAHDLPGTQLAGTVFGNPSLLTSAPTGGEGDWTLEIRDDGRGFDVPAKASNGGRGLRSFRERAAELGGRCEIHSTPGAGTRVIVIFPETTSP